MKPLGKERDGGCRRVEKDGLLYRTESKAVGAQGASKNEKINHFCQLF